MSAKSELNEIAITRVYDADVETVWDAWTDPEQVAQWWGPRGFSLTTHGKDLRAGGHWSYTMHGPDGEDYENKTIYHEVKTHSKLVYDHGGGDDRPPLFRVTVMFSEAHGKTKMEMTMSFPSAEAATETRKFIKSAGGDATWDRLAEYLEHEATGKETFVINRSFDAPIDLIFEMWTNPKHFEKWLPPTGAVMKFLRADIEPGGRTLYTMTTLEGVKMYGRAEYIKINKPNEIVYTQQFVDENENISRHPFAPTWPETMLTTVQFTAEGPDQTRITVTWEPNGKVTAEELDMFISARGGMTQGWSGSFDKLENLLSERTA